MRKEGKITLEKGMLFANVDAFRQVLKDYAIQEGFEIVHIRNERTRDMRESILVQKDQLIPLSLLNGSLRKWVPNLGLTLT